MTEDPLYALLKNECNSFEIANEKSNKSTLNNNQLTVNSAELDTNIITIIKEIERKSFNPDSDSDSSSSLLLEKSSHRLIKEKGKLKRLGFMYILLFVFLSFLHIFSAINTFVIFYTKDINFLFGKILFFGVVSLTLNIIWFVANFISGCALIKKDSKLMICVLYLLCFAFLSFILDLIIFIYIMEDITFDRFGKKEAIFLSIEGGFIILFGCETNFLRIRIEKIKILKSLQMSS